MAEKALTAVIQEAYIHGVSVDDLVEALGMSGVSKSQVSRLWAEIDERVTAFLKRPLEGDPRVIGSNRARHDAAPLIDDLSHGAPERADRLGGGDRRRPPRSPSVNTRRLVVEEGGFLYDSDAYDDELPYWVTEEGRPHLVVPYSLVHNDAKYANGTFGTSDDWLAFHRDAFDMLYREGRTQPKMMSVGLHMRLIGHPARAAGLERFLDYVSRHRGVWVTRRLDIARHWAEEHPPER